MIRFKFIRILLFLYLTCSVLISCSQKTIRDRGPSSTKSHKINPVQIVFDIDYTIVQPARHKTDPNVIEIQGEYYQVKDWASKIIQNLNRPGVEIYFFSGGKRERNIQLLNAIKIENGKSLADIAKNIFSYSDLKEVKDEGRFSERLKKDLKKIGLNIKRAVLIDDNAQFAVKGQDRNMLWLGNTYHFYRTFPESFEDHGQEKILQQFIPEDYASWFLSRNKLKFIYELLDDAIKADLENEHDFLSFIEKYKSHYIPYDERMTAHFDRIYSNQITETSSNCRNAVAKFVN